MNCVPLPVQLYRCTWLEQCVNELVMLNDRIGEETVDYSVYLIPFMKFLYIGLYDKL